MFLEYGVSEHGELVHISEAPRGLTELHCPYCAGQLLARKGSVLVHHFAHNEETCREVAERDENAVRLPLYDRFNLELSGKDWEALQRFHEDRHDGLDFRRLQQRGLVEINEFAYRNREQLTKLGKIPFGELSLDLFGQEQDRLIREKHDRLESLAEHVQGKPIFDACLSDLRLYRAQIRRVLTTSLYFLEINGGPIYKVGLTTRDIDERLEEIRRDLVPHFDSGIEFSEKRVYNHRGAIELYFKHRYRAYNHPLEALTEYFEFEDRRHVLTDLSRMGDRPLSPFDRVILAGGPSGLERSILAQKAKQKRRLAIKDGMMEAASQGKHVGRPEGSTETTRQFLAKYPAVAQALVRGSSLRQTAERAGVSVNTVRKVKAAIADLELAPDDLAAFYQSLGGDP